MAAIHSTIASAASGDGSTTQPADRKQARPPEMHPWTADQLASFLSWSAGNSPHARRWRVLAYTGMRRAEVLALRWRDIDTDAATIAHRPVGGRGARQGRGREGPRGRHQDRQAAGDRHRRRTRWRCCAPGSGSAARCHSQLARDDALVFADLNGGHLHPERFWRTSEGHRGPVPRGSWARTRRR